MNAKFQAALLSWFRAAASAAVALYLTGVTGNTGATGPTGPVGATGPQGVKYDVKKTALFCFHSTSFLLSPFLLS